MQSKTISLVIWVSLLFSLSGCWRQEIVTFRVEVSPLRSDVCAQLILNQLDSLDGVQETTANADEGWVDVVYDSAKIARKNIEILISKNGFDANGLPGDPAARAQLPEACR